MYTNKMRENASKATIQGKNNKIIGTQRMLEKANCYIYAILGGKLRKVFRRINGTRRAQ